MASSWLRLVERPELASGLPAIVSSALADRETGWKRRHLEGSLEDVWMLLVDSQVEGFANFQAPRPAPFAREAELTHVWLRRSMRRQGWLRAAWPVWREHYGSFRVSAPNDEMAAALAKLGRLGH